MIESLVITFDYLGLVWTMAIGAPRSLLHGRGSPLHVVCANDVDGQLKVDEAREIILLAQRDFAVRIRAALAVELEDIAHRGEGDVQLGPVPTRTRREALRLVASRTLADRTSSDGAD